MKESEPKSLSGQDCCSREMTVVEQLEHRRDNLIQELARTEKAIKQVRYSDLSNDTLRVLINIGR